MSEDLPLVTVIVPARNEEADIADCVDAIGRQLRQRFALTKSHLRVTRREHLVRCQRLSGGERNSHGGFALARRRSVVTSAHLRSSASAT